MRKGTLLFVCVAGLALLAVMTGGVPLAGEQDKGKAGKPPAKDASPATFKVVKKLFQIELEVKGTLEPEKTAEIAYRPQPAASSPSSGPLLVQKAVDHGTRVAKDDVLLVLDTKRIDQVIDQLETDKKLFDAKLKLAEEDIVILKQTVPIELARAEQASKQADEDLKYFSKVGRSERVNQINYNVKRMVFWVESEKEDLRQLEKMYKSKDLTEETEKIILKRQQFWVEMAEFYLKQAEVERNLMLNVSLPREEKMLTDNVTRTALELEKAKVMLAPQVNEKEQNLVKLRYERDKITDQLDNLQKDRQAMTIKAPMAGIVYYGKLSQGKWTAATDMADKLVPNGTINADQVLMTLVNPRPILVRLLIDEKDIHLMKTDLKGKARVPFNPDLKLPAKVIKVSPVPTEPGKYETLVSLELGKNAANLMPGMACAVKFVPYAKKDALVIPNKAIFEEEDRSFVWVMAEGKKEKREVEPGRSTGEHTEILDGLREGEAIVAEAKEGEKAEAPAKKGAKP